MLWRTPLTERERERGENFVWWWPFYSLGNWCLFFFFFNHDRTDRKLAVELSSDAPHVQSSVTEKETSPPISRCSEDEDRIFPVGCCWKKEFFHLARLKINSKYCTTDSVAALIFGLTAGAVTDDSFYVPISSLTTVKSQLWLKLVNKKWKKQEIIINSRWTETPATCPFLRIQMSFNVNVDRREPTASRVHVSSL